MTHATIQVAGETLLLLPEKAVYWPDQRMLIVADIHFGKAAAVEAWNATPKLKHHMLSDDDASMQQ